MSWILIFISTYVAIVVLFILVLMNWLYGERLPHSTYAVLRGC